MIKFIIDDNHWSIEIPEGYESKKQLAWRNNRPGCWARKGLFGKDVFIRATQDKYDHVRKR